VKIRKLTTEVTEKDLTTIMQRFGEVTRVKIPMDEHTNRNKGFAFVTYKQAECATKVIEQESIVYEFYELPVERATQSRMKAQGGPPGGFGGPRRGGFRDGGDRPPRLGDKMGEGDFIRRN